MSTPAPTTETPATHRNVIEREHDHDLHVGPYPDEAAAVHALSHAPLIDAYCHEDCLDAYTVTVEANDWHDRRAAALIDPTNPDHTGTFDHVYVGTGDQCEHTEPGGRYACGWERYGHPDVTPARDPEAGIRVMAAPVPADVHQCPNGHGPMVRRTDPTPMQAEQGDWFDCPPGPPGETCTSATLVPRESATT